MKIYSRELVDAIFKQPYCRIVNLVDAKIVGRQAAFRDEAKAFYQHFTFEPSPSDPYHRLLITKDLLQMVAG